MRGFCFCGSGGFTVTCGGAFAAFFDFDFFDDGRF
tara:strand:+ start:1226 stop:1330 length:105 start_codon:yes stop_codon:yes gene_type:complete